MLAAVALRLVHLPFAPTLGGLRLLGERGSDPALNLRTAERIIKVARLVGGGVDDGQRRRPLGLASHRPEQPLEKSAKRPSRTTRQLRAHTGGHLGHPSTDPAFIHENGTGLFGLQWSSLRLKEIVDAAMELHQTKGLAATTISDIADQANVGRVTVYRHFPDEESLVGACSGQYFAHHPFPDPAPWGAIEDPLARLRRGLQETYAYHRETEPMMSRVIADARDLPIMAPYQRALAARSGCDCRRLVDQGPPQGVITRRSGTGAQLRYLADVDTGSGAIRQSGH